MKKVVHSAVELWIASTCSSFAIKNTGFRNKSGVFLISRAEMSTPKTGVELALELAAENAKMENRKNPTFSGKLGFSAFTG